MAGTPFLPHAAGIAQVSKGFAGITCVFSQVRNLFKPEFVKFSHSCRINLVPFYSWEPGSEWKRQEATAGFPNITFYTSRLYQQNFKSRINYGLLYTTKLPSPLLKVSHCVMSALFNAVVTLVV
jgi:hypothetical protein